MWYFIANYCLIIVENKENNGTEEIGFVTPSHSHWPMFALHGKAIFTGIFFSLQSQLHAIQANKSESTNLYRHVVQVGWSLI